MKQQVCEKFDFAIVGAGAAGLHLSLAMIKDPFFRDKKIVIFDKSSKNKNDRTWCFWETGSGNWDSIVHKIWDKGYFVSADNKHQLDMKPYRYKMLRSIDFYTYAKNKIDQSPNFTWIEKEVNSVRESHHVTIHCGEDIYEANHLFDSRIDDEFYDVKDNAIRILQHFKGWTIETEEDIFNPEEFVMMDFRLKWKDSASFTYVLPSSKRNAIIEFTLFTPALIEDSGYDNMLKEYCEKILNLRKYKIVETEKGIIPMTDFPFHKKNNFAITKIGTAGSWVKPSSGYSFKNAERYSKKIVENIRKGKLPSAGIAASRHRKYDSIFLGVLHDRNELGERIFTDMYLKNPASRIFRFLDEESSIAEEIKIISSFESAPFIKSLFGVIKKNKIMKL